MRMTLGVAAAALAVGWGGTAMAATVTALTPKGPGCDVGEVTLGGAEADACAGAFDGNDSNQELDGLFGYDWTEAAKDETPGADDASGFGLAASGGTSGTWGVESFLGYETVMVVIKGGDSFAAYLFEDVGTALAGTFSTASLVKGQCAAPTTSARVGNGNGNGNGGGNGGSNGGGQGNGNGGGSNGGGGTDECKTGPGLSHVSLYVTGDPIVPPPVPVPAAGLLLLTGLAGLPLLGRRRRS